ncbi:MAG: iron-sulfur cluster assembly accessory protein [Alphaproteobacteria bacterium]|nr:iron-sulfur cluster assembly accessory protein [Alphaproteobacteria bacterium]
MDNNRNVSNTINNQPATGKYKYSDNTIKYYENLKNVGGFDENLPNVGTGIVGSPLCGDVMKVQLFFDKDDKILDVKYKVFGCVSAIASMEMVSELLKGMTIDQALSIRNEDVANSLELSELKRHCSVLAKECIEAAVNNYKDKQSKTLSPINITKEAANKIKELINEHNSIGINISVISGGCSGIDYTLGYVNEKPTTEQAVMEVDGIKIYYDPSIEVLLNGVDIELFDNGFGAGFIVTNKNHMPCANCTCNCGIR